MNEKMDKISMAVGLLGIKSWLEFYGKDFFSEELFDDFRGKIMQYADIAFKKIDFLRVVDRIEEFIYKRGLLRTEVSKEKKEEFKKAL